MNPLGWLIIIGALVGVSADAIHLAHGAPFPVWPCSQCRGGWVDAMTGMCPDRAECRVKVSQDPGQGLSTDPRALDPDINTPPWKLRVLIATTNGTPLEVMNMINADRSVRHWGTQADCEKFMDTEEYEKSMGPLATYIANKGLKAPFIAVTFTCVPDTVK